MMFLLGWAIQSYLLDRQRVVAIFALHQAVYTLFGIEVTGYLAPIATLPVLIYNYATAPEEDLHQQAWAAGFVLLTLVLVINVTARLIIARGPAAQRR